MSAGLVYLATCRATGLVYVGCTTRTLQHRRRGHHSDARRGSPYKFHRALREYGESAFSWTVLGEYPTVQDMLLAERGFIEKYNSVACGYNTSAGGYGNSMEWGDGSKRRASKAQVARFRDPAQRDAVAAGVSAWVRENPEEHAANAACRANAKQSMHYRKRAAATQRAFAAANPELFAARGAQHSALMSDHPEVRARISQSLGGNEIEVLKDGQVVHTFLTQHECARALSLGVGNINSCLRGRRRSTGGYQFRYKDAGAGEALSAARVLGADRSVA